MAIDPLIARGYQGGIANAFYGARDQQAQEQRRNAMVQNDAARLAWEQQQASAKQAQGQQAQASVFDLVEQAETAFEQGGFNAVRPILGRLAAYDPQIAEQIARTYQEDEQAKGPGFGNVNPGDYTPRSLAKYAQTGNYADLERQYAPAQPILVNTPGYGAGLVSRTDGRPLAQFTTPEQEMAARSEQAAAETQATESVKAKVEQAKTAKSNSTAFNVYAAGMKGIRETLSKTTTGPIAGRAPAYTENQQMADGAIAAMAPVLKQMFRSSGEGTFTDKDQTLLMEMLPTRKDRQKAIAYKTANIDNIVRAKLGQPVQPTPSVDDADLPTYSPEQAALLPSGTAFKGVDGKRRVKR